MSRAAPRLWSKIIFAAWLTCVALTSTAYATAFKYYVLAPEASGAALRLTSLEPSNTITAGLSTLTLQQYESASVPISDVVPGTVLSGTAFFQVSSDQNAGGALVPQNFAGTSFAIPHLTGQHKYYIYSASGSPTVTVNIAGAISNLTATQGVVQVFDAGSDNTIAGRITATTAVLVAHVAYVGGIAQDAYAVAPAATQIIGIRSQNVTVGGLTDATTITAYVNGGATTTYAVSAGQKVTVTLGNGTTQGQGSAVRLAANFAIGAIQTDDGDGANATALQATTTFGKRFALPTDAQYVAIACVQTATTITLFQGAATPVSATCSGTTTNPGKVFLGSATNGVSFPAGSYLIANKTIYATYEVVSNNDEYALSGWSNAAGPAVPTLVAPTTPTSSNPITLTGTATANLVVRIFVNGRFVGTSTADAVGAYSYSAALEDGVNQLYATAVSASSVESDPSLVRTVTYNNTIPRIVGAGTLSTNTVWTPGSPATPYDVTGTLTIAAGTTLTLQPGTVVRFLGGFGYSLTVNGTFIVKGKPGQPVTFQSTTATAGSWTGIRLLAGSTGSVIDNAVIRHALYGVEVNGVAATISNSTFTYFSNNAVRIVNATVGTIVQQNVFDNTVYGTSGTAVYVSASSPTIRANRFVRASTGIHVFGNSSPTVSGGNEFLTANYQILIDGAGTNNPNPLINGNRIQPAQVTGGQLQSGGYLGGATITVNATGNWWGSNEPYTIADGIYDNTDSDTSTGLPIVNYNGFLNSITGPAVTSTNVFNGILTAATTTLATGQTYNFLGTVIVPVGKSLIVQAGATIKVHPPNGRIRVDGSMKVNGVVGNLATITTGKVLPIRGSWVGVVFRSTATASYIDGGIVDWATIAVDVDTSAPSLRNSTVRNFLTTGARFKNSLAGAEVRATTVTQGANSGTCIWIENASPNVIGNSVSGCSYGIKLLNNSSPAINGNNIVSANSYNIYIQAAGSSSIADPAPVITGNQIFGSTAGGGSNLYTSGWSNGANTVVNATSNWWGNTVIADIADGIYDQSDLDSPSLPFVNFSGYLNAPNGTAVLGNFLVGPIATNTTLSAGVAYDALGSIAVRAGSVLTMPAGTTLRFYGANSGMRVDGSMQVQGTAAAPVILTAGSNLVAGSWKGISIRRGNSVVPSILIDYAEIDYAANAVTIGVEGTGGLTPALTIRNSKIRRFSARGINVANFSSALIDTNVFDGISAQGVGLEIFSRGVVTVTANILQNCNKGIVVSGASNPTINNGNDIHDNNTNIEIAGAPLVNGLHPDYQTSPIPLISGNKVYNPLGGVGRNLYISAYMYGPSQDRWLPVINAPNNWWGSPDAAVIADGIYDATDTYVSETPVIDFRGYLNGVDGNPDTSNVIVGRYAGPYVASTTYFTIGRVMLSGTIPAGVTFKVHPVNAVISADDYASQLIVQGTASSPVVFTSAKVSPTKGSWGGLRILQRGAAPPLPLTGTSTSITYAKIEWAQTGVTVDGALSTYCVPPSCVITAPVIANTTIKNFSVSGVQVNMDSVWIHDSVVDNVNATAVCIRFAAPIMNEIRTANIENSVIKRCSRGLQFQGDWHPTITGSEISGHASVGIYVDALGRLFSAPFTMTGNRILNNLQQNIHLYGFAIIPPTTLNPDPRGGILNATGNWWGTDQIAEISNKIVDASDTVYETGSPYVDFSGYLLAAAGPAATGPFLVGPVVGPLPAGTYDVLTSLVVRQGSNFTIPAGTTLRFPDATGSILVHGTMSITGTANNPVTLTTAGARPVPGSWSGLIVDRPFASGADATNLTIDGAVIDWAKNGVSITNQTGASLTVQNSTIRNFLSNGILISNSTAPTPITIQNNIIDGTGSFGAQSGIYVSGASSPLIVGNTIRGSSSGIYLYGAVGATINGGNIITQNGTGIRMDYAGAPQLLINGNSIFGNLTRAIDVNGPYDTVVPNINLRNNWWGTNQAWEISTAIVDRTDYGSGAVADYSAFLDTPNGVPVAGNYLVGPLYSNLTLAAGTTYDALGVIEITTGKTLTIPSGVTIRMHASNGKIQNDGNLAIQGTAAAPVRLLPGRPNTGASSWQGIGVGTGAGTTVIDFAQIDLAQPSLFANSRPVTVRDSVFRRGGTGISLFNSTGSEIRRNFLDGYNSFGGAGFGIRLDNASAIIADNRIQRFYDGINMNLNSSPSITGNAIVFNGRYNIQLGGTGTATGSPTPTITGNDIYGAPTFQMYLYIYGVGATTINATGNWWGTTTPTVVNSGAGTVFIQGTAPTSVVDISGFATGPITGASGANLVIATPLISPNADGIKDSAAITGTLSGSAAWTLNIRNLANSIVRTFTGSGTAIAVTWDGKNDSSVIVPDGTYAIELSASGSTGIVATDSVAVDTTPPTTGFSAPANGALLQNVLTVPLSGSAADTNFVSFDLQYGVGASPSSWTNILPTQTTAVANGPMANWVVNTADGSTALANGLYTLRVQASDAAGNVATSTRQVTLNNVAIVNVTRSANSFNSSQGQSVQIGFTLQSPGTVVLSIYPELGGPLVRQITQIYASAGTFSLAWNGRDGSNNIVPDEAYRYTLTSTTGSLVANYDPLYDVTTGAYTGANDPSFDAAANDFYKAIIDVNPGPTRARVQVTAAVGGTFFPIEWAVYPFGPGVIVWNGRDLSGQLVTGPAAVYAQRSAGLYRNYVIVAGGRPKISGGGSATPTIEVKSDPYRIQQSFDQISHIVYRIDMDANVTVKLLPPFIGDPNDPSAIVLVNNELQSALSGGQPLDHTVEWRGYNPLETRKVLVQDGGIYTFSIEATSVITGQKATYLGALQIRQ